MKKLPLIIILILVVVGAWALLHGQVFKNPNVVVQEEKTTASFNQKIFNGGVYITPLRLISDSRCPIGVQCIWAGEVAISVLLEKSGVTKEVEIKLGNPVVFEGSTISLINATPEKKEGVLIIEKDYQFTFNVAL